MNCTCKGAADACAQCGGQVTRLLSAMDTARRYSASAPENEFARQATIVLDAAINREPVSSKAAEAAGDQAAKVRDMCYQIPAKGGYPLVAAPAAPSERGDLTQQRCLYCSKPDSQVYHEAKDCPYQPSIPSLSEVRERFERWARENVTNEDWAYRMREGRYPDARLNDAALAFKAGAGLSSQEGK